jgi:transcriptional regulator with XRE-family HTH domain
MGYTNKDYALLSDAALMSHLGGYIKHTRIQRKLTQAQLAEAAGLNRWTISQVENGESITLSNFIKILRILDALHVMESFEVIDEISPIAYAKLKKQQKPKHRVRGGIGYAAENDDIGW